MKRWTLSALALCATACGGAGRGEQDLKGRVALLEERVRSLTSDTDKQTAVEERLDEQEERLEIVEQRVAPPSPSRGFPGRPNGAEVYAVSVEGDPFEGPKHAWVTVVKAYEFACPFCERTRHTMDAIRSRYGGDVRVVYKNYIVHPETATAPALAVCAAHKQGKFKKMYDLVWDRGFKNGRRLDPEHMLHLARRAGVSKLSRFKSDRDGACAARVQRDQALFAQLGVTGTPSFFINGRFLSGARPLEQFAAVIDEELKKAKTAGIPVADYYAHILKSGRKTAAR